MPSPRVCHRSPRLVSRRVSEGGDVSHMLPVFWVQPSRTHTTLHYTTCVPVPPPHTHCLCPPHTHTACVTGGVGDFAGRDHSADAAAPADQAGAAGDGDARVACVLPVTPLMDAWRGRVLLQLERVDTCAAGGAALAQVLCSLARVCHLPFRHTRD